MNHSFEQDIPFEILVPAFLVLLILSNAFLRWQRNRIRIQDGQLPYKGTNVPSIAERVSKNSAWASGEIKASGGIFVAILWVCSIVWVLTLGVSFINSLSNPAIPLGGKIVLGILSLGAIPFIFFAVKFTIRHFRFGTSYCRIDGKAGIIGKELAGTVRTSVKLEAKGDHKFTLQCLETYKTGTGKNSRTHVNVLYQEIQKVPHAGTSSLSGIPFSFPLAGNHVETGHQLSRGRISWQLKIETPVDGVDYLAIFTVPVFKIN